MRAFTKYTAALLMTGLIFSFSAYADVISDVPFGETTTASPLQTAPPPQSAAAQETTAAATGKDTSSAGTVLVDSPDSTGSAATGTSAPPQETARASAPPETAASQSGEGASGPQQTDTTAAAPPQAETTAAAPAQSDTAGTGPVQTGSPVQSGSAGSPVPGTTAESSYVTVGIGSSGTSAASAGTAGPGGTAVSSAGTSGPGASAGSTSQAPAASVSSSGAPGADHANDARARVDLGYTVVSPNFSYNGFLVAEGMVQLSDGSWATIGHDKYIRQPYFRLIREDGDWYVVAVHASRIGNFSVGSTVDELWLKKSECTASNSIELNTTSPQRQQIVKTALGLLGKGYRYAGNGPDAYDCSGFVNAVMTSCGISIARTSYEICNAGTQVGITGLRPGDIVGRPGHVGIYIGGGNFVHAAESSTGVITDSVEVYNRGSAFSSYVNVIGD